MTGPTQKTRDIVLERDAHTCQWCGRHVRPGFYSLQHRRARGMGGSKRDDTNKPSNLVTMCGSGTTGCHGYVESNRLEGLERGFTVPQGTDPRFVPLRDFAGVEWFLVEDGRRVEITEPAF